MGTNVHGHRSTVGVIIPSTNTVVEEDYSSLRTHGTSYHYGRMYIEDPGLSSDEDFVGLLQQIRSSMRTAVRDVLTVHPDYLVMGMSAETFWGGVAGNAEFEERVSNMAGGLPVATGASACREALRKLGASRIAVLTPYQPIADQNVATFFREAGFEVSEVLGLKCPSATAIAAVGERELIPVLQQLSRERIDAIVQVGTNLSMMKLAAAAEKWLGVDVVAINAATVWHSLRMNGFADTFPGYGRLLEEF